MRHLHVPFLLCAPVFAPSGPPLFAQNTAGDPTRCAIPGSMTVSAGFGWQENASQGGRDRNRDAVATMHTAVKLYSAIDCPEVALQATGNCVTGVAMAGEASEGPGPAAQAFVAEANSPRP